MLGRHATIILTLDVLINQNLDCYPSGDLRVFKQNNLNTILISLITYSYLYLALESLNRSIQLIETKDLEDLGNIYNQR